VRERLPDAEPDQGCAEHDEAHAGEIQPVAPVVTVSLARLGRLVVDIEKMGIISVLLMMPMLVPMEPSRALVA
jgi:hypothetical protein